MNESAIPDCVIALHRGGIVLYPTDTLYGLAADPFSDQAVERLFAIKERDRHAAIPLIAGSLAQAQRAGELGAGDLALARAFWPGPLTIVVPAREAVSRKVLAGGTTVAIRVPAHPIARALAEAFGACITATSANLHGQPPASRVADVGPAVLERVDVVLDGGATPGGPPSTIVQLTPEGPRLLRAGAIAWERVLESVE
jgi:L-threonylcarbamoyladenylate synthase